MHANDINELLRDHKLAGELIYLVSEAHPATNTAVPLNQFHSLQRISQSSLATKLGSAILGIDPNIQ